MCLSLPGKIKSIKNNKFFIDYETQKVEVNNSLVKGLKVGDWVLVQNKFIVQQFTERQVEEFFKIIE